MLPAYIALHMRVYCARYSLAAIVMESMGDAPSVAVVISKLETERLTTATRRTSGRSCDDNAFSEILLFIILLRASYLANARNSSLCRTMSFFLKLSITGLIFNLMLVCKADVTVKMF